MRLPIVDNVDRPEEFDWLHVRRVVPPPAVRHELRVRRDASDRARLVHAAVAPTPPHGQEAVHTELDAMLAGELVAAIRVLVESGAPPDVAVDACGGVGYEVEVSWAGVVHRYVVDGDPVDDALGGVIRLVSRLLDAEPRITGVEPAPPSSV